MNGHRSSCSPTCIQTSVPGRSVITKSFGELILMNDKKISSKGKGLKRESRMHLVKGKPSLMLGQPAGQSSAGHMLQSLHFAH